jgi:peroxiredoxin
VVQLHHRRSEFEALKARVLLIGFEPTERARAWLRRGQISFPFLLDPNRSVYRAYELERSLLRSWHPRNLWFYYQRLRRGEPIPRVKADPNQLGGDFIIDRDRHVRLAYYSNNPTYRPSVEDLLAVLRNIEATGESKLT